MKEPPGEYVVVDADQWDSFRSVMRSRGLGIRYSIEDAGAGIEYHIHDHLDAVGAGIHISAAVFSDGLSMP